MLATLVDQPFDSKDWVYETKWDGFRLVAEVRRELGTALLRNGIEMTARYPSIAQALRAITSPMHGSSVVPRLISAAHEEGGALVDHKRWIIDAPMIILDIDTATVESLNAVDPKRPIREAVSFFDPQRKSCLIASGRYLCRKNTQCCKTYIALNRFRSKEKLLHHSVA